MNGLRRFFGGSLSRVIFVWFAVTILATTVIVSVTAAAAFAALGGESRWQSQLRRGQAYLGNRLVTVWDDPEARSSEIHALGDLGLSVTLHAPDGTVIESANLQECGHRALKVPIVRNGETLGRMELCDTDSGPRGGFAGSLALIVLALWIASAVVARRIARPLDDLATAAQRFGGGELDARAPQYDGESELAKLSSAFNGMAERIEAQIEDQKVLLAEVSHELRTPLGHMQVLLELARDNPDEPKHVDALQEEIAAIDDLVEQLLANSRLGFDIARSDHLDPVELAVAAIERVDAPVELLEADENLGVIVGDAALLGAALTNLLRNAQTHGGGVTKFVIERRGSNLAFVVEDRGPGLDPELTDRLFEPFVQGETRQYGLGLGLSLVARIVRAHGGDLIVEGSRVGFSVPRSDRPGDSTGG